MTDLFKYNDYSLFEFDTKYLTHYTPHTIYIDNSGNRNNSDIMVFITNYNTSNLADMNFCNVKSVNDDSTIIYLTNKDEGGTGSVGSRSSYIDYVVLYKNLYYKIGSNVLFTSGKHNINSLSLNNTNYFYFLQSVDNSTNNIVGVTLIQDSNNTYAYGRIKDSGNGGKGGLQYTGDVFYLGIHKDISLYFKTTTGATSQPIIDVSLGQTDGNGYFNISHNLDILIDNYYILLTPIRPNTDITENYIYHLTINTKSKNSFNGYGYVKDARDGNQISGGKQPNLKFNWAVIRKT